jgi:predicted nuclease of predicted toxin-antitoxin system
VTLWIDNQISPALADWCRERFGIDAVPVRNLGLARAADHAIFMAAREAKAVVMTKDADFARLLERFGAPPEVVWLTCGNTSNVRLREILQQHWPVVTARLAQRESLIEIADPQTA